MRDKLIIAGEVAMIAYVAVLCWVLFPQSHEPIRRAGVQVRYRWQVGREQLRIDRLEPWAQEAMIVRGRYRSPFIRYAHKTAPRDFPL